MKKTVIAYSWQQLLQLQSADFAKKTSEKPLKAHCRHAGVQQSTRYFPPHTNANALSAVACISCDLIA